MSKPELRPLAPYRRKDGDTPGNIDSAPRLISTACPRLSDTLKAEL